MEESFGVGKITFLQEFLRIITKYMSVLKSQKLFTIICVFLHLAQAEAATDIKSQQTGHGHSWRTCSRCDSSASASTTICLSKASTSQSKSRMYICTLLLNATFIFVTFVNFLTFSKTNKKQLWCMGNCM